MKYQRINSVTSFEELLSYEYVEINGNIYHITLWQTKPFKEILDALNNNKIFYVEINGKRLKVNEN